MILFFLFLFLPMDAISQTYRSKAMRLFPFFCIKKQAFCVLASIFYQAFCVLDQNNTDWEKIKKNRSNDFTFDHLQKKKRCPI
ncbi:hypothetical protein BY458DRAFT_521123 [Sporodiniella umbellata]|nr:hypothetical protein BY458DRAFT_521123 [Sporodiniella umbellata]